MWLPVQGDLLSLAPESSDYVNGFGGNLFVNDNGALATDFNPVTFDYSDAASSETGVDFRSLQDLTAGNNYRLRRLVGKIFISATVDTSNGRLPNVLVGAGFMVNRTDPSGNAVVGNLIGPAFEGPFGPLSQDSAEDPWIWRRTWLLSCISPGVAGQPGADIAAQQNAIQAYLGAGHGQFPQTNVGYGSVADGPHIDQKTARVISTQERLFFWIQAVCLDPQPDLGNDVLVNWRLDLRILASLRSGQGNRRNASR